MMQKFKNATQLALMMALMLVAVAAYPTAAMAQEGTEPVPAAAAEAPMAVAELPPPPSGEVETKTEQIENPYGMEALWKQGDLVAKSVLVIMLIMSAATWYIMFVKLVEQQKLFTQAKSASDHFWSSASLNEGLGKLKQGSPFWYVANRGMTASEHHEGTMVERIALNDWITMSISRAVEEIQSRLQGGLAVLATVGSTAPFVGLFGTVWGIYHALTAIGISGQASIDKVAGPVGEALIMTAIGLAVAVPAVMGYNWLVRRNKAAMERVRAFSGDLHAVILSGARVGDATRRRVG